MVSLPYSIFIVWSLVKCCFISGADYHLVHWLFGPDLFLLLCLPGGERCCRWGGQNGLLQLRRCPLVGCGKATKRDDKYFVQKKVPHWCWAYILVPFFNIVQNAYISGILECHMNLQISLANLKGYKTSNEILLNKELKPIICTMPTRVLAGKRRWLTTLGGLIISPPCVFILLIG